MQYLPCAVLTIVGGGVLAFACKREAPPAPQEARAPSAAAIANQAEASPAQSPDTAAAPNAAAAADSNAAPAAGSDRYSEKTFDLKVQPSGSYTSGAEGKVEIVLDAKPPFHVNNQYPYKFKTKGATGLKFPQPVVGKDQAKLETQRVTMAVPFVAESPGKHNVAGQFAFSVCTDETCLMEKRELALVVDVK